MKRHPAHPRRISRKVLLLPVLLALGVCLVLLCACDDGLPSPLSPRPVYDMTLTFDGERTATLKEEVLFTNDTGEHLDELAFHLYPNAFSKDADAPPCPEEEREEFYYNGESFGGIEVSSVRIDGKTSVFELSEDGELLTAEHDLPVGDTVTVSFSAELTLPECNARFGVTETSVNFSGFYPVLCVREDGGWRTEGYSPVGDPFFSETSDFFLTLTAPSGYAVACSGEILSSSGKGETTVTEIAAERVRDFALFLSEDFENATSFSETETGKIRLEYFFLSDSAPADTLSLAAEAVEFFSETFGDYPYPVLTLVQAPVGAGGMEYGALAAVDTSVTDEEEFRLTLVHEIAHQWWFGVVGSDQLNSPWLDEGLTEFSAAYFFLCRGEKDVYLSSVRSASSYYARYSSLPADVGFDGRMDRPLSSYLTNGEYVAVTYCKGLLLFDALLSLSGRERMNAALQDYFSSNAFGIADAEALASSFARAGMEVLPVIEAFTEGRTV